MLCWPHYTLCNEVVLLTLLTPLNYYVIFLYQSDPHRQLTTNAVLYHIEKECDCSLEEGAIDQEVLLCDDSQANTTVFRAEIVTYLITSDDLLIIIQNMVAGKRLKLNESMYFRLDNSCPVAISSFNDPLCSTAPFTNNGNEDEETKSPTAAIIGSIIAVIIIIIVLIVFILLIVLYRRGKTRYSFGY